MSWESTAYYYRIINETIKEKLGGLNSAKCLLFSVNFAEIEKCQVSGNWEAAGEILTQAAQSLERAGADFIGICTNTMHKVAPQIQQGINIPVVHLASETAKALQSEGFTKVGLLGTKFTMEQDFYKQVIKDYGISVIIPSEQDRQIVHDVIYNELCLGIVREESRNHYLRIIDDLTSNGAQGLILGCTEICMLIEPKYTSVSLFNTTAIHARRLAEMSIS